MKHRSSLTFLLPGAIKSNEPLKSAPYQLLMSCKSRISQSTSLGPSSRTVKGDCIQHLEETVRTKSDETEKMRRTFPGTRSMSNTFGPGVAKWCTGTQNGPCWAMLFGTFYLVVPVHSLESSLIATPLVHWPLLRPPAVLGMLLPLPMSLHGESTCLSLISMRIWDTTSRACLEQSGSSANVGNTEQ